MAEDLQTYNFADSFEDFLASPEKYGFVSFENFRKNKSKWMGRSDDILVSVDAGDKFLHARHKYFVDGIPVDDLEKVERMAKDMGTTPEEAFDLVPQVRHDPSERRGFYLEVNFRTKPPWTGRL